LIREKLLPDNIHWQHPGSKLREVGPQALTDAELLAILLTGIATSPKLITPFQNDFGMEHLL